MAARAQQPVSLKDTLQWMHNFVADKGRQYVGQSSVDNQRCELNTAHCEPRQDMATFDAQGCSATVSWSVSVSFKDLGIHAYHFSLKDLDPKSVSWVKDGPFENAVEVDATNTVKSVIETFTPPNGRTEEHGAQSWVEIVFDNGDDAKRFVNAFKHAIQLCGGKSSVF
jgi:hypothetical protein